MDDQWSSLSDAHRVLPLASDARPAWLWSQDGQRLIWSNAAASLFGARIKKNGIRRLPPAVPIKGQVGRIYRLGTPSRSTLARIQFMAGDRPISATCTVTPLSWENDEPALLIVAVDAVDAEVLAFAETTAVAPAPAAEERVAAPEAPEDLGPWQEVVEEPDEEVEAAPAPVDTSTDEPDLWSAALADDPPEPEEPASTRLTSLVDRLASDDALFTPLTADDDKPPEPPREESDGATLRTLYRVTGRGFAPPVSAAPETPVETPPDAATVERVSRYNFDELTRILSDRVGERTQPPAPPAPAAPAAPSGALINLGGETLVLNRLPLGILVFRDQQVLFANRAITEMIGYESVESLRRAGLSSIFPSVGGDEQSAGPVNHLVQQDGTLVPVTARLQSISWQGRPALMLSASTTEVRTGHEVAVKAFAESLADLRGDGFLDVSRSGMVNAGNAMATSLLGQGKALAGRSLADIVSLDDAVALRGFLDRPARFAESERPSLTLRSADGASDVLLFALGQAGILSGYFGFVTARATVPTRSLPPPDADPALLTRISRGVRRPLNTVSGFADLMRNEAFGPLGNERYASYADDIVRASRDIAALVDELDDYARLRDGRYLPERARIDLTALLESCVLRIRDQANAARVIVRNAISERLPKITADRASLAQAVLNLLASAIDQTPNGAAVIISAQRHDDGAIVIQVRDSSAQELDMTERFVVFRDGIGPNGQALAPVKSSVGLALTRALLAVNAISLSVDPAGAAGLLFSLKIPADLVDVEAPALEN